MPWFFVIVLLVGVAEIGEKAALVRESYLDLDTRAEIGFVFDNYRWFDSVEWSQTAATNGKTRVTFQGRINDHKATEAFEKRHTNDLPLTVKSLHLQPTYGLDRDKDGLSFIIHFEVEETDAFAVVGGELGIRRKSTGEWRTVTLSDKALLKVVEGIYTGEDPYAILINGLPYK